MSEPLDTTPVYRNLKFTSAFFGLTPLDMPLMLVPGGVVFLGSMLVGCSTMWGFITAAAVGAALVALKWRRPDDYVETLIHTAFAARRLSHKERDAVVLPFPLDGSLCVRAAHVENHRPAFTKDGPVDGQRPIDGSSPPPQPPQRSASRSARSPSRSARSPKASARFFTSEHA